MRSKLSFLNFASGRFFDSGIGKSDSFQEDEDDVGGNAAPRRTARSESDRRIIGEAKRRAGAAAYLNPARRGGKGANDVNDGIID